MFFSYCCQPQPTQVLNRLRSLLAWITFMPQLQYHAAEQKALLPTELRTTYNMFMQILKSLGSARGRASSGPSIWESLNFQHSKDCHPRTL